VASTKDISVGGFYMNTQADLPEGSILLVRIPFPNGKQVVANAEVVYNNPSRGVGLRFQSLSEENRALIETELGNG
jgi:PilZ domain-containing protein